MAPIWEVDCAKGKDTPEPDMTTKMIVVSVWSTKACNRFNCVFGRPVPIKIINSTQKNKKFQDVSK